MNNMTHKGYSARIEYDDRDGVFTGRILGIADIIGFHGESVPALKKAFAEAVAHYLESCAHLGKEPQAPASGRLMLRISPEIHRAAIQAAQAEHTSLNQWAARVLGQAAAV